MTESVTHFKSLLADQARHHWKLIPPSSTSILSDSHSLGKGKARELLNGIGVVEPSSVQVHCRTSRGGDVLRAVAEISVQDGVDLDIFKAILQTPDVREACECHLVILTRSYDSDNGREIQGINSSREQIQSRFSILKPESQRQITGSDGQQGVSKFSI